MSLITRYFTVSIYILFKISTIWCYSYQSKPFFLSFSELAALEGNSLDQINTPTSHVEEHQVEAFVVNCHEDSIEVVIKVYQFDPGLPPEPKSWRLGPVGAAGGQHGCTARESRNGEFIIRAPLIECGSQVMFTQSYFLYNNLLLYSPPTPDDVWEAEGAGVPVQCEYGRRYSLSSRAVKPIWSPKFSIQAGRLDLDFNLRLMTEDWSTERASSVYFLGDTINMEASVDHPPLLLRLYADSCVATLSPDVESYPRYPFIDHQGCFTDSELHDSRSRFLPRVRDQLLQIQLEPFFFHQDHSHTVYITCYLEAEPISKKEPVKRACSFMSGRWKSVDGDDHLCGSCRSSAKPIHRRALWRKTKHRHKELYGETTLGPILFSP